MSTFLYLKYYLGFIKFIFIFLDKKKLDKIYLGIYKFYKNLLTIL
jgi:hypothetical protein